MNLVEIYLRNKGQPSYGHCTGVSTGCTGSCIGYSSSDDYSTIINSQSVDGMAGFDTAAPNDDGILLGYDPVDGRHASDFATISLSSQLEDRMSVLESRVLDSSAIADRSISADRIADFVAPLRPIRMIELDQPMTAVFQGSNYEIILQDGSVIRASNFQVREIREDNDNERNNQRPSSN